jgi:hypothetical protein
MGVRDKIAKAVMDAVGGIKAYHSSPHDFDRFDLSKIGTGEGAQVYGHGIYAAENPAVSGQGGQYWQQFLNHPALTPGQQHAGGRLRAEGFDREKAIAATQRDVKDWMDPKAFPDRGYAEKMLALRQAELEALMSGKAGPRTYELNINADPAQMLDWDAKIGQQTPAVQDYFRKQIEQFGPDASMEAQYKIARSRAKGGGVELSAGMNEAGIPGIKYLDEGSRISSPGQIDLIRQNIAHREALLAERPGDPTNTKWLAEYQDMLKRAENPTSNYVVFDPSIIDITKKYALPGALGAGAMGSIAAQDQYEVAQ